MLMPSTNKTEGKEVLRTHDKPRSKILFLTGDLILIKFLTNPEWALMSGSQLAVALETQRRSWKVLEPMLQFAYP